MAEASGLETGEAVLHLRDLSERGMVVLDPGPFGGWGVTERGRITDEELARSELDTVDARDHVLRSYESFLGLNPALLDTCGAWQMRRLGSTPMLNDHTDSDYDAKVLSRLIRIDVSAQRICSELTSRLMRFGLYGTRLRTALEHALGGNIAYVTDTLDSYHSVWFQLHEDLLVTLGISREDERRTSSGPA